MIDQGGITDKLSMITPKFKCHQDDRLVYVHVNVPHVKMSEIHANVDGSEFTFYLKPYYLRLTFSGRLLEQEDYGLQYDVEHEVVVVKLAKEQPGTMFEDLDLVTKLLTRKKLIEEIDSEHTGKYTDVHSEQQPAPETGGQAYYGFDNQFSNFFTPLQQQSTEIVDVPMPIDDTTAESRRQMRLLQEEAQFDAAHYVADLQDDDEVRRLLSFAPWYRPLWKLHQQAARQSAPPGGPPPPDPTRATLPNPLLLSSSLLTGSPSPSSMTAGASNLPKITIVDNVSSDGSRADQSPARCTPAPPDPPRDPPICHPRPDPSPSSSPTPQPIVEFTDEEQAVLRSLPRRHYLVMHENVVLLTLVDLLLAYTYDHLTTEGEPTCESPWTVVKLSPSLCWLETHQSLHDVAIAFARRVCVFPLHRHFALIQRCLKDVVMLLQSGVRVVLKALLALKQILHRGDWVYVLCKLYLDPYIVWLQSYPEDRLHALGTELLGVLRTFRKAAVGLDLPALEEQLGARPPDPSDPLAP